MNKLYFFLIISFFCARVHAQFSGDFSPAKWTFSSTTPSGDGSVNISGAPASIILSGSDNGVGEGGVEYWSVVIAHTGKISFNYNMSQPDVEMSYYTVNGVSTLIASSSSSGTISNIPVNAGDRFSFDINNYDNCCGRGVLTISNFVFNEANEKPTISTITNKSACPDNAIADIPVTIGDKETTANNLGLTATSSNSALLPVGNVVFGGTGANRTLSLNPVIGQTGSSNVVVTVTDENGATSSTSFTFTNTDIIKPVAISKNITVQLSTSGSVTVNASQLNNGSTDNCGIDNYKIASGSVGTVCNFTGEGTFLSLNAPAGSVFKNIVYANYGNSTGTCGNFINGSCSASNSLSLVSAAFLNKNSGIIYSSNDTFGDPCNGTQKRLAVQANYAPVTTEASSITYSCVDIGVKNVVLYVTDNSGNVSTVNATITVEDKIVPVITSNGNKNVNIDAGTCGATVTVSATATDNCTVGTLTGVRSDAKSLTALYPVGTTTITWNVTDTNGNAATAVTQTVTVTDNQKPVIVSNGNKSVNTDVDVCGATVAVSATATDNCTVGTPTGVRSDAKLLTDVYPVGTTTITWNVTDTNGNAATAVTQTVTVTDNQKPVIVSNGNKSVNTDVDVCGATVAVSATSTDNCTVGTPTGVRSDAKLLTDVYLVGTTTITWNVTDANGNAATAVTQTVTVTDNQKPVIVSNGNKSVNTDVDVCGATVAVSATATDNCTVGNPTGVRSDAKLLIDVYLVGTTTITWNVTDANGNAGTAVTQTVTVTDNQKPVIVSNGNKSVNTDVDVCGATVAVSATATDNCTVGNPTGVRSDAKLLTDVYPVGTTTITWNVTDANGNAATAVTQTVTVIDNQIPVIVSNGDQNANVDADTCGATVTVSATATDNCTVVAPTGVRSDAKLLTDVYPVGTTTIKWNVKDINTNDAVEVIQTVIVTDNQKPVIVSNGDQNVNVDANACGAIVAVSATATDNCTVVNPTGVRSDAKLLTDVYPVGATTITWNVTDANGNAATAITQTVIVTDNQKPVIVSNGDQNVNTDINVCGAIVTVSATATDNCTVGNPTGVRSDAKLLTDVYPVGTTIITWNVSDANGNAATAVTQTVTVMDNQIPVIVSNGDKNVNADTNTCGAIVTVSGTATDNCTVGNPTGVRSDAKLLTDVYPVGTTTITWNVKDINTNDAVEVIQTVIVTDNQKPVIVSNGDQNVNVDANACGAIVAVSATATDNCTVGNPTGVRSDAKLLTDVYPVGATTITWNVTDANGNAATAVTQTITVTDNQIPVIVSNGDKNVNADTNTCGAIVTVSATATDNCTVGNPTGVRSDAKLLTDVYPVGTTTITWNVSDANGNAATAVTQTVTVMDNQIPVIVSNGDKNVNADTNTCGAIVTVSATATDNCTVGTPTGVRSDGKSLTDLYPIGMTTIVWNVTDVNGNHAVEVVQIIVVKDNIKPTVITKNTTIQLDAAGNATIQVSDVDDNSFDNCEVVTRVLDKTSFTCANVGPNTVKLTVTDKSGNFESKEATVIVEDNIKPIVATKNIIVQLDPSGNVIIKAADVDNNSTDNCGIATRELDKTEFTCANIGPNTVKLKVTDKNGNFDVKEAIVTIENKIIPKVLTKNITLQLNAAGNASIVAADIDNRSTLVCGIPTLVVTPNTFTCANVGVNIVTLTATDAYGNVSSEKATVTIEDKIAAKVLTKNATIQLDATGNAVITASQIDNGSSDLCGIASVTVSPSTFSCNNLGVNTVTLTVTDVNGNKSSATATVTVQDNILPIAKSKDLTVELDDAGNASITVNQINNGSSDNCSVASVSLDKLSFDCTNVGVNTVVLTVKDKAGNIATATAKVTVVNKFADNDNDGIPDNCDDDDDNDGIKDSQDNCPITFNPYQEDRNHNGLGDACDKDQVNISEAFTPNGDGINDTWVISNIEYYPASTVRVFNRWGTEVFVARNYQNDWDGHYKGNSSSLPESSSYYYQIDLDGDGKIDRQGWIYINR